MVAGHEAPRPGGCYTNPARGRSQRLPRPDTRSRPLAMGQTAPQEIDLTRELHGPTFEPLGDPDFFAQVRANDELGTIV
jgi:hypothetical protein